MHNKLCACYVDEGNDREPCAVQEDSGDAQKRRSLRLRRTREFSSQDLCAEREHFSGQRSEPPRTRDSYKESRCHDDRGGEGGRRCA